MSELTPCNYCNLNNIRYRAEKKGLTVTLKLDNHGWTSVYVHPPDAELPETNDHDSWPEYQVASMMAITDHCVC